MNRVGKCCSRAWTLIETMVTMFLLSILTLVIAHLFGPTIQLADQETKRATLQGQAASILSHLEKRLQTASVAGIGWLPESGNTPAVLAIHGQDPKGLNAGIPIWENHWTCFLWSKTEHRLSMWECPPGVAIAAPPADRAQAPSLGALASIAAVVNPPARLLCSNVDGLKYSLQPGPLAQVVLELGFLRRGAAGGEKLKIERQFYLRISDQ
jgi:type II secretory pathway pseudopilin PulG